MSFPKLKEGTTETMKFVGMIFMMVSGSLILANALGQSGVSGWIADVLIGTGLSGMGIVMILLIVYLLFGLVADAPIILMLTIPVLWPLLEQMGVDLIWFGVVSAIVAGMGGITPPYAMGIFILRAIACPDVPLRTMYRGIIPFCLSSLVVVALICIWPQLVVWLVNVMK
jgi:TRAP-type C4-dicarboxylate transport system permease large subunit